MHSEIIRNIKNKNYFVGIVGLGYVGIPLALRFIEAGYLVKGFDIDSERVEILNSGRSPIEHIPSSAIQRAREAGFEAVCGFDGARQVDALILCVPTPLNKYREPDISYIISTMEGLLPHLRAGQLLSLESTTYPGTTEEELLPRIQDAGLRVGEDFFLVFSPEREDPGNPDFTTRTIPKVCGGVTENCSKVGCTLYGMVIDKVVPVSSTRAAEMTKLLENIHRAVNIGLVNEMKIVADRMGIDIHEVIRAAATKPFGFVPYYPGPGLGGHCIPIDPFYLTWKAREYGVHTRFIELAGEVNSTMPEWVIQKVVEALNDRQKCVNGSRVLVLGVAYKKNVDDMRESPSIRLIELLQASGAQVEYSDPHVPHLKSGHHGIALPRELQSLTLTSEAIASFDLLLLATNHDKFDYTLLREHAKLIVDTRGVYEGKLPNVVKA